MVALGAWEGRMCPLGFEAGDLDDGPSFWAEQRRRIEGGDVSIAILGDWRILYDTDLARFESLTGVRPVQLAIAGSNTLRFLETLAAAPIQRSCNRRNRGSLLFSQRPQPRRPGARALSLRVSSRTHVVSAASERFARAGVSR